MSSETPAPNTQPRRNASALVRSHTGRIVQLTIPAGLSLIISVWLASKYYTPTPVADEFLSVAIPLIAIWTIGLSLLISFKFLRNLTRPVELLSAKLRRVNLDDPLKSITPIPPHLAENEFGALIASANRLLRQIDEHIRRGSTSQAIIDDCMSLINTLQTSMNDGLLLIGSDQSIISFNKAAQELLKGSANELKNLQFANLLETNDRVRVLALLARLSQTGESPPITTQVKLLNQPNIEGALELCIINTTKTSALPKSLCLILLRTIKASQDAQEQLKNSEERMKLAIRASRCGIWDINPQSGSLWWSSEFINMLGYDESNAPKNIEEKYSLIHPDDMNWVKSSTERYLAQEASDYNPEYRILRKDGTWIWLEDHGTAEWDDAGLPIRFSGTVVDCTERKRFEQQMMYMVTHDAMTDLPNRTLLNDRLEHALIGNARNGLNVAVLLLDIDRFKLINDSLGYEIGDHLVRAVAQRLQQCIRPTDTLARLSGDEFVVVCEDLASPQEAARVAKRLLNSMAQHFMVEGNQLTVGISIGISVSPVDGQNAADILRHADTAMHSAKAAGGNCYRFFVNEMNKEAVQRLTLERYLNEAVERQQFVLHYQPKVDIQTREVVSAEALIRWPHRTLGNISPLQFISIAEETGQIIAIGEWVLRESLSQICLWRDRGYEVVPIAVNLSGKQLMAGGMDELVLRLLDEYKVPPHLLEIEVTESVMAKMDKVLAPLKRLRDAGLGIALDDFGTGYSSLAYLQQLPISSLKIDRSFVKDVPEKHAANSIANIILDIGRQLGLKVVAEGIETEAQLEFLRKGGCDIGQGWLFSKAITPTLFQEKLKKIKLQGS